MIVEKMKNCLNQCFVHIHRCKKYVFLILDMIDEVYRDNKYLSDECLRNFVLNLLLYRQTVIQHIYDMSAVASKSLYLIKTSYELD